MIAGVSAALGVVDLLVVCGNIFVLYVLASQKSLHSPTNFLVLSLTISDLLLGLLILPFSIMQEHRSQWVFGETWCTLWLALDVWFSTASIYNLLAISFDRYMAVRQPIKYPIISSTKVIRLMIFAVWAVSFLLACILLVFELSPNRIEKRVECIPLNLPDAYILFSASFSFIVPAVIMVVLNVCIFRTVLTTSRSRCVSVKSGAVMRIHRGNEKARYQNVSQAIRKFSDETDDRKRSERYLGRKELQVQTAICSAMPTPAVSDLHLDAKTMETTPLTEKSPLHNAVKKDGTSASTPDDLDSSPLPTLKTFFSHVIVVSMVPSKKKKSDIMNQLTSFSHRTRAASRFSLRTELRVARTTAVVVGAFVICWFPFTTIYVLQAYEMCAMATGCIPNWMFLIAFWLGYSNSAVNPLLYAAFSRDFRAAFRKVLLRPQLSGKGY